MISSINSISFTGKEKTALRTLAAGAEKAEEEAAKLANKVAKKVRGPKAEFVKAGTDLSGTYNEQVANAVGRRAEVRSSFAKKGIVTDPADRYTPPFAPTNVAAEKELQSAKIRSEFASKNIDASSAGRYTSPFAPINTVPANEIQVVAQPVMPGAPTFDPKTVQHIDFFA